MSVVSLGTVPLACGSFVLFHTVKGVLHRLRRRREGAHERLEWRPLAEVLTQPGAVPYLMVAAPRWNPHALLARAGPFEVHHRLRLQASTAHRAAALWTLVLARASDGRPVAALDASGVARDAGWVDYPCPPGRYVVALRYYAWGPEPWLPALELDGQRQIPARPIAPEPLAPSPPRGRPARLFYAGLHYHMLELLRWRPCVPEAFVRRHYLPVGNPATAFCYGYLRRGEGLALTSVQGFPVGHRLYFTLYDRASFPVYWTEVRALPWYLPPVAGMGSYLWRLHPLQAPSSPQWPSHLQVTVR